MLVVAVIKEQARIIVVKTAHREEQLINFTINKIMDFTISYQDMISMLMSILCGGIIGFNLSPTIKSS